DRLTIESGTGRSLVALVVVKINAYGHLIIQACICPGDDALSGAYMWWFRLGSNQRGVVPQRRQGVPHQLRIGPVRVECRTGKPPDREHRSSCPSDVLRHATTR